MFDEVELAGGAVEVGDELAAIVVGPAGDEVVEGLALPLAGAVEQRPALGVRMRETRRRAYARSSIRQACSSSP